MQVKLTIGERLKDLRVEQKLTLERLATEVGISKSALGKYESDNGKDISPYSIFVAGGLLRCFLRLSDGTDGNKKSPKHSSA